MPKPTAKDRAEWIKWLKSYGPGKFFDAFVATAQDAESQCIHCGQKIYLDIVEGGGAPDWGSALKGFSGLDYGCPDSPDTNEEGTGGHQPKKL
jgi:hypothetical protein